MRSTDLAPVIACLIPFFLPTQISAAPLPVCTGASFGKACVKCDSGACYDPATRKTGACSVSRCGEAAKPFVPPPRESNTGY